ncbi:MAG: ArsR family transcriptional regulator [Promethearchaeota archaeon]
MAANEINKTTGNRPPQKEKFEPAEEMLLTNPEVIPIITHEKKKQILELLFSQEMTIMEISKATEWNPGTVKRHLMDLLNAKVVIIAREEFNQKKILLKYYRAAAKHFTLHFEWP